MKFMNTSNNMIVLRGTLHYQNNSLVYSDLSSYIAHQ